MGQTVGLSGGTGRPLVDVDDQLEHGGLVEVEQERDGVGGGGQGLVEVSNLAERAGDVGDGEHPPISASGGYDLDRHDCALWPCCDSG